MAGPPPNPNAARRNNKGASKMIAAPTALAGFELPDPLEFLPPYNNQPQTRWHPATVRMWKAWRSSPQAMLMVTEPDWSFFLDTAMMHHQMWVSGNFERAAEVRMRQVKFGVTPEDRARLRVEVELEAERYPAGQVGGGGNVTSFDDERAKRLAAG